jgi:hypothetical protein
VKGILKRDQAAEQPNTDVQQRRFAMTHTGYHSPERRLIEEIRKGNFEAVNGLFAFPLGTGRTDMMAAQSFVVERFTVMINACVRFLSRSAGKLAHHRELLTQPAQHTR